MSSAPFNSTNAGAKAGERIESKLAKNLVAARVAAGLTQQQLADASDVSRATIAQIEAGVSDPKLSTVLQLAQALQVSALLLLLGTDDISALSEIVPAPGAATSGLSEEELRELQRLVSSGMLRDRAAAAKLNAEVARAEGLSVSAVVGAAIGGAIHPGRGTELGKLLGERLGQ